MRTVMIGTQFEQDEFRMLYRRVKLSNKDGHPMREQCFVDADEQLCLLFRYAIMTQQDQIHPGTFWTPVETLVPEYASAVTGLPVEECVWRAKWKFPLQQASRRMRFVAKRKSFLSDSIKLVLAEFYVDEAVPLNEIEWHKLEAPSRS